MAHDSGFMSVGEAYPQNEISRLPLLLFTYVQYRTETASESKKTHYLTPGFPSSLPTQPEIPACPSRLPSHAPARFLLSREYFGVEIIAGIENLCM